MALYKAKIEVKLGEVVHPAGDIFEVTDEDAKTNGWDVENDSVEPAGEGESANS